MKKIYSKEIKQKVFELYKTGLSTLQIAKKLSIGKTTIWRWCKKAGISRPRPQQVVSKIKQLTKDGARWLAGIIDCDGSISKISGTRMRVMNTDLRFIKVIQKTVNGGYLYKQIRNDGSRSHWGKKPLYTLQFRVQEVRDLLPQIIDYLIIKKERGKELLKILKQQSYPH